MSRARSAAFSRMRSCQRRSTIERSFAVFAAQAGKAACAAATAFSVDAASKAGTVPSDAPVAGLCTGNVAPPGASSQAPFT